ncbi:hypothetical protein J6590_069914 [Homalodisca vitripennis]|nr:hypothetical protein J6590_069914 [Homalodisca vitripennis]
MEGMFLCKEFRYKCCGWCSLEGVGVGDVWAKGGHISHSGLSNPQFSVPLKLFEPLWSLNAWETECISKRKPSYKRQEEAARLIVEPRDSSTAASPLHPSTHSSSSDRGASSSFLHCRLAPPPIHALVVLRSWDLLELPPLPPHLSTRPRTRHPQIVDNFIYFGLKRER